MHECPSFFDKKLQRARLRRVWVEPTELVTVEREDVQQEPGIARFDVLQQQDDPTRFLLVEVYRSAEAPAAHKQTAHYREWAETVADMMAVPRTSVKFARVYPEGGLP